jgi:hypothetical protein
LIAFGNLLYSRFPDTTDESLSKAIAKESHLLSRAITRLKPSAESLIT